MPILWNDSLFTRDFSKNFFYASAGGASAGGASAGGASAGAASAGAASAGALREMQESYSSLSTQSTKSYCTLFGIKSVLALVDGISVRPKQSFWFTAF